MAICRIGNVDVVLFSRDEHCPPHVHAVCDAEGWSARYTFSYLHNDVEYWDMEPVNPRKPPSKSRLAGIGAEIALHIPRMRRRWQDVFRSLCLEQAYVEQTPSGLVLREDGRKMRPKPLHIVSAAYDPVTDTTSVVLSDGSPHQVALR